MHARDEVSIGVAISLGWIDKFIIEKRNRFANLADTTVLMKIMECRVVARKAFG